VKKTLNRIVAGCKLWQIEPSFLSSQYFTYAPPFAVTYHISL
jgi:hypothetical protein